MCGPFLRNLVRVIPALLIACLFLGCGGGRQRASPSARTYLMGMTHWPENDPARANDERLVRRRVARTIEGSELIQIQVAWAPSASNLPLISDIAGLAREHERSLVVALDWLAPDRKAVSPSSQVGEWSFEEAAVRDAFSNTAVQIARSLQPRYLVLGVEVNYYAFIDPEGFRQYVALFRDLRTRIGQVSPRTSVAVTFQYELLMGRLGGAPHAPRPHPELISHFGPELDLVGLSTYPILTGRGIDALDLDYYQPIAGSSERWGIFETAWPAESLQAEQRQLAYLTWLARALETSHSELLIWTSACDAAFMASDLEPRSQSRWVDHLGLWKVDATPKTAAATWLATLRLPRNW